MTSSPAADISLEYFPAASVQGERALVTCAHALRRFDPAFQTVTFGADGGERERTLDWAVTLRDLTGVETATHLTLCAFDRAGLDAHLAALEERGLRRIVLLRGDKVREGTDGLAGFASVADAVRHVKRRGGWDVTVAAYPEQHPRASSERADLDVLLAKFDAGADRAITQFVFDTGHVLRLRDRLARERPAAPLVAGLMPITNWKRASGFAAKCGASIPEDVRERFERASTHERTGVARGLAERLARELAEAGERALHVYTMNRVELAADTLRAFEAALPPQTAEAVA